MKKRIVKTLSLFPGAIVLAYIYVLAYAMFFFSVNEPVKESEQLLIEQPQNVPAEQTTNTELQKEPPELQEGPPAVYTLESADKTKQEKKRLPAPRKYHSCIVYARNRNIYCFGGADNTTIIEYDPEKQKVTQKNATLPMVLAYLACVDDPTTKKVYCFGGRDNGLFSRSILVYEPERDILTKFSVELPEVRAHQGCAKLPSSHKIYCIAGGGGDDSKRLADVIELNPQTQQAIIKMPKAQGNFNFTWRYQVTCAGDSSTDIIYCFGGADNTINGGLLLNEIIAYNTTANTISLKEAVMPTPRRVVSCTENTVTNKIYCFGGDNAGHNAEPGNNTLMIYSEIFTYDPKKDAVEVVNHLPTPVTGTSCVYYQYGKKIYCFGGLNETNVLNDIFSYTL